MIYEAAQYRKSVKARLQCDNNTKERLLSDFDRILSSYLEEYPNPSMDDLVSAFGPPEAVAAELMRQLTPQELANHRKNSLILRILALIFAAFLAMTTVYIWFYKEVGLTLTTEIDIIEQNDLSTLEPTTGNQDEPMQ